MECPNCHAQVEEVSNFCPQCGYDLMAGKKEAEGKDALGRVENTGQNLQNPGAGAQKKSGPQPLPPLPRLCPPLPMKNPPPSKQVRRRQSQREAYRELI